MIKPLLIAVSLLLSGCNIYPWELNEAQEFCADNGGLHNIHTDLLFNVVVCNNSKSKHIQHFEDKQ